MTRVYCPMKKCKFNDAMGNEEKEGICFKKDIDLFVLQHIVKEHNHYQNFPFCPEYTPKDWTDGLAPLMIKVDLEQPTNLKYRGRIEAHH